MAAIRNWGWWYWAATVILLSATSSSQPIAVRLEIVLRLIPTDRVIRLLQARSSVHLTVPAMFRRLLFERVPV